MENQEDIVTSQEETVDNIPTENETDNLGENTASDDFDTNTEEGTDPENLKAGFGRNEYAKTIGNADYYKQQGEELRRRQEQSQIERANRYKNKANGEEDNSDSDESNENNGSSLNEQKEFADESKKSAHSTETDEQKKKNIIDKANDAKNVAQSKMAVAQNKIDAAKAKVYQKTHPVEAAKAEAKEKLKKKLLLIVKNYWWVFAIALFVLLLLIIILLIILGAAGEDGEGGNSYLDPQYDFTMVQVTLTDSNNEVLDNKMSLRDLVLGSVYYETRNRTDGLSDDQLLELYKSFSVLLKTEALALGGYDSSTMKITIRSGTDMPYCDPYNGCVIKNNNGVKTYVSKADEKSVPGTVIAEIPPIDDKQLEMLEDAYDATLYELITPKSVKEPITKYSYEKPEYTIENKDKIAEYIGKNKSYEKALEKTYSGYKIYDLQEYATKFEYTNGTAYWWPIGSKEETSSGIYGGTPTSTSITSEFTANRCIQGTCKAHKGIDIGGSYGVTVIIATRGGKVVTASDGCPSTGSYGNTCGGGYGNWVMIDHGDGTSSVYAHMYQNSITVKVGDTVQQGEKIGLMGSSGSSTGTHTHFEIRINGTQVDPLTYVSVSNPRPASMSSGSGQIVQGNGNVQTVCLSLKASGFSNEAVAGILANIQYESNFNTNTFGDNGTSAGLCQWHLGRLDRLKSHCSDDWTDAGCQVSYLIWELQNSEKGTYNTLINGGTAYDMGAAFCTKFERPADTDACYSKRAVTARDKYYSYVTNNCSN